MTRTWLKAAARGAGPAVRRAPELSAINHLL